MPVGAKWFIVTSPVTSHRAAITVELVLNLMASPLQFFDKDQTGGRVLPFKLAGNRSYRFWVSVNPLLINSKFDALTYFKLSGEMAWPGLVKNKDKNIVAKICFIIDGCIL
jgi:hypothetical protein